jgi:hypothetical protein
VLVRARDAANAAQAAQTMAAHGAQDIDACADEEYALIFGEYPAAPGRIYNDPRSTV